MTEASAEGRGWTWERRAICPSARKGSVCPHAVPSLPGRAEPRWFTPLPENSSLEPWLSLQTASEHLCSRQETVGDPLRSAACLPRPPHPCLHQDSDAFTTSVCSTERAKDPRSGLTGRRTHVKASSLKMGPIFGGGKKKNKIGKQKKKKLNTKSKQPKTSEEKKKNHRCCNHFYPFQSFEPRERIQ